MSDASVPSQDELLKTLPEWIQERLSQAGHVADSLGMSVFLVGGIVRDLLLDYPTTDIDLMVEGDGLAFSTRFSRIYNAKLKRHPRFGTAVLDLPDGTKMDVATARSERYETPAALPTVEADTFQRDLQRRDFTINAMAICLNGEHYGKLMDPHGGRDDLHNKVIRILHSQSFVDDPTRLFRAIRFEQRFAFTLEPSTLKLFQEAVIAGMISRLSEDRLREQIRLILEESDPWPVLARLDELGVLTAIAPGFQISVDGRRTFESITRWRHTSDGTDADLPAIWELYLLGLAWQCTNVVPDLIDRLKPGKRISTSLRCLSDMKVMAQNILKRPTISHSELYTELKDIPAEIVFLTGLLHDHDTVRQRCMTYYHTHRHTRPIINGQTLNALGIPDGPVYGEILDGILRARLDGLVETEQDERDKALEIWEHGKKTTGKVP